MSLFSGVSRLVKKTVKKAIKYNPVALGVQSLKPIKKITNKAIDIGVHTGLNIATSPYDFVRHPSLETLGSVVLSGGGGTAIPYGVLGETANPNTLNNVETMVGGGTLAVGAALAGAGISDMLKGSINPTADPSDALNKAGGSSTGEIQAAGIFSNKWFWIIGGGVGMVLAIAYGRKK